MVKSLNWVNLSTPPPLGSVTHILPLSIMLMPQKSHLHPSPHSLPSVAVLAPTFSILGPFCTPPGGTDQTLAARAGDTK